MPLASIDVGSNSVRLFIGDVSEGKVLHIRYERVVTRLAGGITATGRLLRPNMEKTILALKRFLDTIRQHGAGHIKAVGTSALREAENSKEFLKEVSSGTGIEVEVISGEKEAEITARGVVASLEGQCPSIIVDIGGGSTEWILTDGKRVLDWGTLPVGVVKLLERHIKSDPPSPADIATMEEELSAVSEEIGAKLRGRIDRNTVLIFTAGTATTLAAIDLGLSSYDWQKVHMHEIGLDRLAEIKEMLMRSPLTERAKVRGLEPDRADLIIPGIHFTIKLVQRLGFERVLISDHGLLEGILLELFEEVQASAL